MLIKRLEVKGFKSLRDVVWEPGPLTVLIGPNGSGKSNLLLSFALLQSIATGGLEEFIYANGGSTRLVWDGRSAFIKIHAQLCFDIFILPTTIGYNIEFSIRDSSYTITNETCTEEYTVLDDKNIQHLIHRHSEKYEMSDSDELKPVDIQRINRSESLLSLGSVPHHSDTSLHILRTDISDIIYYHHLDTAPESNLRKPIVTRFSKRVDFDGKNLINVLHTLYSENRDFENDINTAMRAAFGDDFDRLVFPPAADQLVQLRIRWKTLKREQSMADLSDGTIRFLFLMTVLCNPEPAPLIAIDEPETGLHPSMFSIIAEYAAEASKRTQVIFSTHSPQFLDAFSDFDVTTTVTAWKDGETKIKNLDGDTLKKWLEHYSLGSLFLSGDLEALA